MTSFILTALCLCVHYIHSVLRPLWELLPLGLIWYNVSIHPVINHTLQHSVARTLIQYNNNVLKHSHRRPNQKDACFLSKPTSSEWIKKEIIPNAVDGVFTLRLQGSSKVSCWDWCSGFISPQPEMTGLILLWLWRRFESNHLPGRMTTYFCTSCDFLQNSTDPAMRCSFGAKTKPYVCFFNQLKLEAGRDIKILKMYTKLRLL